MNILLSIYMTVFMSMFPKLVKQQKHTYILYNTIYIYIFNIYIYNYIYIYHIIYIYTVYIRIYQDIYPFICKWRERERERERESGKEIKDMFQKTAPSDWFEAVWNRSKLLSSK